MSNTPLISALKGSPAPFDGALRQRFIPAQTSARASANCFRAISCWLLIVSLVFHLFDQIVNRLHPGTDQRLRRDQLGSRIDSTNQLKGRVLILRLFMRLKLMSSQGRDLGIQYCGRLDYFQAAAPWSCIEGVDAA